MTRYLEWCRSTGHAPTPNAEQAWDGALEEAKKRLRSFGRRRGHVMPDTEAPRVLPPDVRQALEALCDKLDACHVATAGVFFMAANHGQEYSGPTYEHELKAARALLAAYPEPGKEGS